MAAMVGRFNADLDQLLPEHRQRTVLEPLEQQRLLLLAEGVEQLGIGANFEVRY